MDRSKVPDHSKSKTVYLNPNFKGKQRSLPEVQVNSSSMHINPNFSHQLSDKIPTSEFNATRIYINPNFIRTTQAASVPIMQSVPSTNNTLNSDPGKSVTNVASNYFPPAASASGTVTKSRYCLVRKNNENEEKILKTEIHKTTYKINKYKSMPMQELKKNINSQQYTNSKVKVIPKTSFVGLSRTIKNVFTPPLLSNHDDLVNNKPRTVSSRYRLVKARSSTLISTPFRTTNRRLSSVKNTPRSTKTRVTINKKIFNKNNVPCPLYKKFGKCLRYSKGHCEFLHDKKHVSICRKFLKGICHDNACLLSHEVSKEKMPTCSFYLRGMCTKEDCPYLHVKLNENTQICKDFLKGYCEKGGECLNRHVNLCPDLAANGICTKNKCPYPHKLNQNVTRKNTSFQVKSRASQLKMHSKPKDIIKNHVNNLSEGNGTVTDCRYYKEVTDEKDNVIAIEVIKPSRSKLGTLPSFIKL